MKTTSPVPLASLPPEFRHHTFISHNQADKRTARRLCKKLQAAGLDVWLDENNIPCGGDIWEYVQKGLEESRTLILLMSPDSVAANWVKTECSGILFADPSNIRLRLIPVMLRDCEIPLLIRRFRYIDARKGLSQAVMQQIIGAVCR